MYNSLEEVTEAIMADEENQSYTEQGILPLFTVPKTARLVLIGQAPGQKTQEAGICFMDKSGKRLREWLGIDEDIFYHSGKIAILPMDFYFPGKGKSGDLPPRKDFAAKWHPEILKFLTDIQMTVLIGSYAQRYYLQQKSTDKLTTTVQNFQRFLPEFFPIPHPSPRNLLWQKRHPWFDTDVLPVLKDKVAAILERPVCKIKLDTQ